jgi:hypothetical protein
MALLSTVRLKQADLSMLSGKGSPLEERAAGRCRYKVSLLVIQTLFK